MKASRRNPASSDLGRDPADERRAGFDRRDDEKRLRFEAIIDRGFRPGK